MERTQAGQTLRCACGADLDVPTMQAISRLERVSEESPPLPGTSAWGAREGALVAGIVVVLLAGAFAGYLLLLWPQRTEVEDFTPWRTLNLWLSLRRGISQPPSQVEMAYHEALRASRRWMIAAGAMAGLGVLIIAGSRLVGRSHRPAPPS